jgi:pimeloyl-ACP methyl ester carboxylesterase
MQRKSLLRCVLALIMAGAVSAGVSAEAWKDNSPHKSEFVEVNGVRLNVLDWGGGGPPLVLIHGLGDSPHVFDDLAEALCDRFHVIAYARRGHGFSDAPSGPYTEQAYVEDLRQLLDKLSITKASLLGWSMGGVEITKFAALYPERVDKLVYLEAGYDWSDARFLKHFVETAGALGPNMSARTSLDAFRDWYRTAYLGYDTPWTPGLESHLRDITRVAPDGSVSTVPNGATMEELLASLRASRRDYGKVKAPALVLYATVFFSAEPWKPSADQKAREFEQNVMAPFRRGQMDRVRRELKTSTVTQVPNRTHMSIGVRNVKVLGATIGEFLTNVEAGK